MLCSLGMERKSFFVTQEQANQRLDHLLCEAFPDKSRSYFHHLIEKGAVLVNGIAVKKRTLVQEDDDIELFFAPLPEPSLEPEKIPLDIIFEDEDIIVINKPADMVVHPAVGNWSHTLVNALLYHCKELPQSDLRPGIVHRLDKDTTGLIIAAKNYKTHQQLIELFSQRKVTKEYLAICIGSCKSQVINAPIKRDPKNRKKMAVIEEGKEAITKVEVVENSKELSFVRLLPHTGRTHQLRVHMKHLGSPILGDPTYGNIKKNQSFQAKRQYLHAFKLTLPHPIKGDILTFEAPLPQDMNSVKIKFFKQGLADALTLC